MADLNEVEDPTVTTPGNGIEPEFHVASGPNPFYLFITRPNGDAVEIDLEASQWLQTYAEWMRGQARWYLMSKATVLVPARPWLVVEVGETDQPYYTARHIVRVKGRNAGAQITAYGIGAKRAEGHTDRMWILPNGLICCGDDVDTLGDAVIDAMN